jgi:hypothetical protein
MPCLLLLLPGACQVVYHCSSLLLCFLIAALASCLNCVVRSLCAMMCSSKVVCTVGMQNCTAPAVAHCSGAFLWRHPPKLARHTAAYVSVSPTKHVPAASIAAAGSIFCVLLLLAVLTTKPYTFSKTGPFGFTQSSKTNHSSSSSNNQHADGLHGLWSVGGHPNFADLASEGLGQPGSVSCKGPSLRCDVVNRIPLPEVGRSNLFKVGQQWSNSVLLHMGYCGIAAVSG